MGGGEGFSFISCGNAGSYAQKFENLIERYELQDEYQECLKEMLLREGNFYSKELQITEDEFVNIALGRSYRINAQYRMTASSHVLRNNTKANNNEICKEAGWPIWTLLSVGTSLVREPSFKRGIEDVKHALGISIDAETKEDKNYTIDFARANLKGMLSIRSNMKQYREKLAALNN